MASEEPVHPLRLSKSNTMPLPSKVPRALSEISPTEKRRNSPSWNQTPKKMANNADSSPFQSSPLDGTTSPRLFWQNRGFGSENSIYGARSGSPSPTRRSSIERLQKASRVKNSNILALEHKQEYDPTRIPHVERPLAKVQGNAFGGTGIGGLRTENRPLGHHRSESKNNIPFHSPAKPVFAPVTASTARPPTPSKDQGSPVKSSLSNNRFKSSFDLETGGWSADPFHEEPELPESTSLHRHAKSVTFDAAPPQVNEYEMVTPDISSIGSNSREGSYESTEDEDEDDHYLMHEGSGLDDSFDASLEDTDKTPVVGPDDWRQDRNDDPFDNSPMPEDSQAVTRPQHNRTGSTNSNGDHRPLPPLPGMSPLTRSLSSSSNGLSATAERMLGAHRSLPSPPPATTTKSEIQNIGNGKMTLEERLKLMMLSDDGKNAAEQQRERRMRRAGHNRTDSQTPERDVKTMTAEEEGEADDTIGELSGLEEYQLPPRISRESILRRVNGNHLTERESDYNFSSPAPSLSPERHAVYDPDVPIPSTEDDTLDFETDDDDEDNEGSVIVKRDHDDDDEDVDVYEIPELYQGQDEHGNEKHELEDDTDSHYSDPESLHSGSQEHDSDQTSTPRASPVHEVSMPAEPRNLSGSLELPKDKENDFTKGLESYMLSKPEEAEMASEPEKPKMAEPQPYPQRPSTPEDQRPRRSLSKPEYDGSGWGDPEDEEEEEPGTPESVIHHPISDSEDEETQDSVAVPEQIATIKSASGSKLKTRPSATPSDIMAMREARRNFSREVPSIPPIPERHRNRISRDMDAEISQSQDDEILQRRPSYKKRSLTLDLDLGLSLDKDFERVIEAQKVACHQFSLPPQTATPSFNSSRQVSTEEETEVPPTEPTDTNITARKQRGYLMRQNTKLVAASDKETEDFRAYRSAGNSPVKAARPQSWTVEPWNGQARKRSLKKRTGALGSAPPLPGQESNATAFNPVAEEDAASELSAGDSGERGRLFVKVMGVKDLDLPIPKNERTWFSLTLDNGVHCVTTAWLELARNAPIGQEFELVVPSDLEFQLTLNVKLEKPAPKKVIPASPTKISKPKTSTFSRVFASPKKRKEMELRQKEEEERLAQQQREAQARQMNTQPTAWDLLSPLAADDGSFARAYVCLKEHESRCFGRPYLVDVAAFNEWATEEASFASSVKSKRGNTSVVRRAPYKIGKLELQLLFVPRPKGATDDDMPKSMNSCIREMKAAEERLAHSWEGNLSQQGGDCPYWRRRYFKLVGTKLTAYHEATRQPRATINLANAKRLIDDRQALTEKEITGKNGKRRRSAFAEEEDGYMFVEEGFRIRFNNGELIDFYADSTQDKDGWMKVLNEVIGRDSMGSSTEEDGSRAKSKWCELVLKKEEAARKRSERPRVHSRSKSMYT
ncbi:cell division protein anillin-domain-containing protein [Cercophora scortea]|uniref:Cell division protein anillin-domain-containing protein n=1 Tax=Cercophora scortea TaxID=314031 RepID=A0AAE0IYL0_9PEZI|nr:cell division protein anillin-domain-containing protein [Cercophora scortea]